GSPISEPKIQTEDPEGLRCWSATPRPRSFLTLPQFAGKLGRSITRSNQPPVDIPHWETERLWRHEGFGRVFGDAHVTSRGSKQGRIPLGEARELSSDGEVTVNVQRFAPPNKPRKRILLLDLDPDAGDGPAPLVKKLLQKQVEVVTVGLRATGKTAPPEDHIAQARDHNSAQWGLWVGKPLLTQWVRDVRTVLDALPQDQQPIGLAGVGAAGMVALCSAVAERRIREVALLDSPLTLVTDQPADDARVGILVPDMLRRIGDVAQLVALCSPRRVLIAGGRSGAGKGLAAEAQRELTTYPRRVYRLVSAAGQLASYPVVNEEQVTGWLAASPD
ncbi:MAG: hypothetical protein MK364_08360, partial [Pirellulales bacterium]|nr:hypothetical protein [Pirellulales bacterium]